MIELGFLKRYDSIKRLIDFGSNGFYPLFENHISLSEIPSLKLTKTDKLKAKSLLKKMSAYENLEKQKVLFSSFAEKERHIVAKTIMEMVEGNILDANPHLQ